MGLKMLQGHYLAVMETHTVEDFRKLLIRFTRSLDFDLVAAISVTDHSPTHTEFHTVDNTPENYRDNWTDSSMFGFDPVMQHCKQSSVPIVWNMQTYASRGQAPLWEEQAKYGFGAGICVTLHLPAGEHFLLGVDRERDLKCGVIALTSKVAELQLFAVHAREAISRILAGTDRRSFRSENSPSLTPREIESLRWTMDGKTSSQVADALNISQRTADFHLQNAARKLECRGKYQAVLKAIRLGLIT